MKIKSKVKSGTKTEAYDRQIHLPDYPGTDLFDK